MRSWPTRLLSFSLVLAIRSTALAQTPTPSESADALAAPPPTTVTPAPPSDVVTLASDPVAAGAPFAVGQTPESIDPNDKRTPGTRARLAVVQTLWGGVIGTEVCALAECDEVRGIIGSVMLGMGAGAAVSVLATRERGVRNGTAMLYNSAPVIGSFVGFELFRMTARRDPAAGSYLRGDDYLNRKAALGTMIASQLGSYGLAYAIDRGLAPTTGEITTSLSLGGWTSLYTVLIVNEARGWDGRTTAEDRRMAGGMLVASIGGMAAGGLLAHRRDMSTGRTMIINAGGAIGGGLGALTAFFVRAEDLSSGGIVGATVGGSMAGLGLTYFLTRNIGLPRDGGAGVGISVSPVAGGAIAQVSGILR